jgi:hypothetical protein
MMWPSPPQDFFAKSGPKLQQLSPPEVGQLMVTVFDFGYPPTDQWAFQAKEVCIRNCCSLKTHQASGCTAVNS